MRPNKNERILTLDRTNCMLLIVDMQEKLLNSIPDKDLLIKKTISLINISKQLNVPLFTFCHCKDKLGHIEPAILNEVVLEEIHEKETFSIFRTPVIERSIDEKRVDQLVILGIEAHICVVQSALDAIELGYKVFVIEDATSSIKPEDKKNAMDRLRSAGVIVLSSQAAAYELIEKAGTQEFKAALLELKSL